MKMRGVLGDYHAIVVAETSDEREFLGKHLGYGYIKEWMTTYGKAYDFVLWFNMTK